MIRPLLTLIATNGKKKRSKFGPDCVCLHTPLCLNVYLLRCTSGSDGWGCAESLEANLDDVQGAKSNQGSLLRRAEHAPKPTNPKQTHWSQLAAAANVPSRPQHGVPLNSHGLYLQSHNEKFAANQPETRHSLISINKPTSCVYTNMRTVALRRESSDYDPLLLHGASQKKKSLYWCCHL